MAKYRGRLKARELRRKGESIGGIAKRLGVSKGSVSLWCRDIVLTREQAIRIAGIHNKSAAIGRIKAAEWHRQEKRERVKKYHNRGYERVDGVNSSELFLVGLSLYWAEGSKKYGEVSLVNSDPTMIIIFIEWLEKCFGVKKKDLTCRVGINESHENRLDVVEQYWSNLTGLPRDQFRASSLKRVKNKKVYANHNAHYGSLVVRVRKSTNMHYEILGSIAGLKDASEVKCEVRQGSSVG